MALLSYFVISLGNEQLFTKNTKILKIVMFSLIHNEMRLDRNPTVQLMTSLLLPGGVFRTFWVGMCRWDSGTA